MIEKTYPRRLPIEPPHALLPSARSQTETFPMSPKYLPFPQDKQKRQKRQQETQKAIFLGGFFVFTKANGKSLSRTEQNANNQHKKQFFWGFFIFTKANGKSLNRTKQNVKKSRPRKQQEQQSKDEERGSQPVKKERGHRIWIVSGSIKGSTSHK